MLDRDLIAPMEVHKALAWLDTPSVKASADYRRLICRESPIRFACTYFEDYLTDPITEQASLARFHVDMAQEAQSWIEPGPGRRTIWVAPRESGKPVSVDALVLMGDGSRKRLGDVEVDDWVITHTGTARRVLAVHEQGELPVVEISTRRGRVVRAAPDHPFLTERGYVLAGHLNEGDRLITVPRPDVVTGECPSPEEFALAGYFIGDGGATTSVAYRGTEIPRSNGVKSTMTVADPVELTHLREVCDALGFTVTGPHGDYDYYLGGGAKRWLVRVGIAASSSYTKRVPQWVNRAPASRIAMFLAAYFACDGTVGVDGCNVEYYSVSRNLLSDTQHLLHRLGIRSTLRPKRTTIDGHPHHSWRLRVENTDRFAAVIGPHLRSRKSERLGAGRRGRFTDADAVTSVVARPPERCRCLTVDVDHTFTVADLVVHNTVWQFLILPIWALAYGHKRFFLAFSHTEKQAKGHLANLRNELATNDDLMADFPELAPVRRAGASNTATEVVTSSGAMFAARGIDSGALGIRRGATRPDLMTGDDLEPDESNYSPEAKAKRLSTLLAAVIPMNSRATLNVQGTTMMHGSIIHEAVLHARGEERADWIDDHGFRVRYYPAIVEKADGSRASMWSAKWPLAELEADEHTALFQLEKMNLPVLDKKDAWWSSDLFVYRDVEVFDRIMHVDIAVTSNAKSDFTAITIMGWDVSRRRVVVEYARQFKISPGETKRKVHELCALNRVAKCYVEVNQGCDYVRNELQPMPAGTDLEAYNTSGHKASRIKNLLYHYEAARVVHARPLPELEKQQRAYPSRAAHDDLVDTVAGGVWRLLGDAKTAARR